MHMLRRIEMTSVKSDTGIKITEEKNVSEAVTVFR